MKFAEFLIFLIVLQHIFFLVLEMFLWTKPIGLRVFRNNIEKAKIMAPLAANQGLYNGFLALGLLWGLFHPQSAFGDQIQFFFLFCVMAAGLYGGYSFSRQIILVQFAPAFIAIIIKWNAFLFNLNMAQN
jgi:putative membrane protein